VNTFSYSRIEALELRDPASQPTTSLLDQPTYLCSGPTDLVDFEGVLDSSAPPPQRKTRLAVD
jgi:hypothetical protein